MLNLDVRPGDRVLIGDDTVINVDNKYAVRAGLEPRPDTPENKNNIALRIQAPQTIKIVLVKARDNKNLK
jgi:hypothetical protein